MTKPKAGAPLQEVQFEEGRYIVRRGENFYLHYRIAVVRGGEMNMGMVVEAKKVKDKSYYYFIGLLVNLKGVTLLRGLSVSMDLVNFHGEEPCTS